MSIWARLKTMAGGKGNLDTLASVATLRLPDNDSAWYVSGTTSVTSLYVPPFLYNRRVTLIGASSAQVSFANTDNPSTAGQMYLHGQNRIIREDDLIELFCKNDGTWILLNLVN